MKSMTGYGYAEGTDPSCQVSVEIKCYNNKYSDINLLVPPVLSGLDERIREQVRSRVARGRADVSIRFRDKSGSTLVQLDREAFHAALEALRLMREELGDTSPLRAETFLAMDGIVRTESTRDMEAHWAMVLPVLAQALDELDQRRGTEGEATRKDLLAQLGIITAARASIVGLAAGLETQFKETLRRRFQEVLGDAVDENRVLQELAVMLVRYSIHEELDRLGTHCRAMEDLVNKGEGVAKRIDFLAQEMNREVNTIGSKSVDAGVSALVVDMKEAIDIIREQVRNIE